METSTIVWIIVGIIIVIAIIVFAYFATSRKRREAKVEADRRKAAELRDDAYEKDVAARESQADAARTQAAAKQAEADAMKAKLDADRLASESTARAADAAELQAETDQRLRKADAVDPDVGADGKPDHDTDTDTAPGRRL